MLSRCWESVFMWERKSHVTTTVTSVLIKVWTPTHRVFESQTLIPKQQLIWTHLNIQAHFSVQIWFDAFRWNPILHNQIEAELKIRLSCCLNVLIYDAGQTSSFISAPISVLSPCLRRSSLSVNKSHERVCKRISMLVTSAGIISISLVLNIRWGNLCLFRGAQSSVRLVSWSWHTSYLIPF